MVHKLQLSVCGKPEILLDGLPLKKFTYKKSLALLVYLVVTGSPHRRSKLVRLLWGECNEASAKAGLRKSLAELRSILGDYLTIDRVWVAFNQDLVYTLDFKNIEQKTIQTRNQNQTINKQEAEHLAVVLSGYRGEFLSGFYIHQAPLFEEWVTVQRESCRLVVIEGYQFLYKYYLTQKNYPLAIEYIRQLLVIEPGREEAHQQLISLLALKGQREHALRQFEVCRTILLETYGTEPQAETLALVQKIQLEKDRIKVKKPGNLPVSTTQLLGRQADINRIMDRLTKTDCRLLTILGPGGMGKTHLAVEIGEQLTNFDQDVFEDGIYFIPLNTLHAMSALPAAIAYHLGFKFSKETEPIQQLCNYLAGKKILLILDNFEHLLPLKPSIEPFSPENPFSNEITILLQTVPGIKFLVTSRIRLNLLEENTYRLSGIPILQLKNTSKTLLQKNPAVRLFLQHIHRNNPTYQPDQTDLLSIVKICRFVDGLPLGIMLAASWSPQLTPTEIADQLDQSAQRDTTPKNRLNFLSMEGNKLPVRHRSLRTVFDHSWGLLSESEQTLLSALSVFPGVFYFETAEMIAQVRLRDFQTLVERSVIKRVQPECYELHPLLRQYAREKANNFDLIQKRYLAFYRTKLTQWAGEIHAKNQLAAVHAIEKELVNNQEAWQLAISNMDLPVIEKMMDGLCLYYDWYHLFPEGFQSCQRLIEVLHNLLENDSQNDHSQDSNLTKLNSKRLLSKALTWQSTFAPIEQAKQFLQQSLHILENLSADDIDLQSEYAFTYYHLGRVTSQTGDLLNALTLYKKSGTIYHKLGDLWGEAEAYQCSGIILWDQSSYSEAESLLRKSLGMFKTLSDHRETARSLLWLGNTLLYQGRLEGEDYVNQSFDLSNSLGDRVSLIEGFNQTSIALMILGRYDKAYELMVKKEASLGQTDFRQDVIKSLLACTLIHLGRYVEAQQLSKDGLALAHHIGDEYGIGFALIVQSWVCLAEGQIQTAQLTIQECVTHCEKQNLKELLSWGLAFQGFIEDKLGNQTTSKQMLAQGLTLSIEIDSYVGRLFGVSCCLPCLFENGRHELTAQLNASIRQFPLIKNSVFLNEFILHSEPKNQHTLITLPLDQIIQIILDEINEGISI